MKVDGVNGDTFEIFKSSVAQREIVIDVLEDTGQRTMGYMLPEDARKIAAELIRLADEIEGAK